MITANRPDGSYDPSSTTADGLAGELRRLEEQAALSFAEEFQVLRDLGFGRSGPVVDVGCGSGAATRRLRENLPGLPILGADYDMSLLGSGATANPGPRGPYICADARALPLRDGSAGAVLMRYVLQHVADPASVMAEARRVLRPGGLLAIVDVDAALWGLAEPLYPDSAAVHLKLAATQRQRGGDRFIGRRLTRLLAAAGLREVRLRPFAVTSDSRDVAEFAPHLGPARLTPLVASGDISVRDLAVATDHWVRFRDSPGSWVMLLGFVATGRAPGPSDARRSPHATGTPNGPAGISANRPGQIRLPGVAVSIHLDPPEALMKPAWKIFIAIFCYITGVVGIALAVINASQQPPATAVATTFGVLGVVFLIGGFAMTRKPRY